MKNSNIDSTENLDLMSEPTFRTPGLCEEETNHT